MLVGQFLTVINPYRSTYLELLTFCILEWLRTFNCVTFFTFLFHMRE